MAPALKSLESSGKKGQHTANKGPTQTREDRAVRPLLQVFGAGEPLYLDFLPFASPGSALTSSSSGFLLCSASEEIRREEPEVPSPPSLLALC